MNFTLMMFSFILILISLLMGLCLLMMINPMMDREKPSPFECGFDPNLTPRNSFSIQFFLIALIFLIFDIEITLLLPIPLLFHLSKSVFLLLNAIILITLLILGLYYEWFNGMLKWAILVYN